MNETLGFNWKLEQFQGTNGVGNVIDWVGIGSLLLWRHDMWLIVKAIDVIDGSMMKVGTNNIEDVQCEKKGHVVSFENDKMGD